LTLHSLTCNIFNRPTSHLQPHRFDGESPSAVIGVRKNERLHASPDEQYPPGWTLFELANGHKQTKYDRVDSEKGTVVRARSEGAISTLKVDHRIDLTTHPILTWRWKIDRLAKTANVRDRTRNDITAAVILGFEHDDLTLLQRLKHFTLRIMGYHIASQRALIYFWGSQAERGSVSKNLHADWFTQIAVRSGSTHVGTWVPERRNVLKDYRTIYGTEPPPIVNVSITTETNNTQEPVTAYYGDILFRPSADSLIGPTLKTERGPE